MIRDYIENNNITSNTCIHSNSNTNSNIMNTVLKSIFDMHKLQFDYLYENFVVIFFRIILVKLKEKNHMKYFR